MVKKRKIDPNKFSVLPRKDVDEAAATLFHFGMQSIEKKDAGEAFKAFRSCLNINPTAHQALYNIALLYSFTGNKEGAYSSIKEAYRMNPFSITYAVTAAEVYRKCKHAREAHAMLLPLMNKLETMTMQQKVLVSSAFAVALYDLGMVDEALELNDRTLELAPLDASLILNRALINMLKGNWKKWWRTYETSLSYGKNPRMSRLTFAGSWHGERLDGKRLLIVSDQGAGDAIQFARYFDKVAEMSGAKIIFLAQPQCKSISALVPAIDEVLGYGEHMSVEHDAYSSLLGVMRVLQIEPSNARRPPHIDVNQRLVEYWRAAVDRANPGKKKKVGIVWAGDPKHGNDHARSIPLSAILPTIRRHPEWRWYSFQVGDAAKAEAFASIKAGELNPADLVDLGTDLRDYADTSAALRALDALVSVDTSIVHVAGCTVGAPKTFVLLSHPMEWRWLLSGRQSPWYEPEVVLLRQKEPQQWSNVLEDLEKELIECLVDQTGS